ncbi:hypothetical protein [Candidatus Electrothrix sp.]|uniref:hypothetical protein n=1 Tax=Candidatus Electrothrix sp. TaxID=2170559 RepID=UPI004055EB68
MKIIFFLLFSYFFLWIISPVLAQQMEQPTGKQPITSTISVEPASIKTTGETAPAPVPSTCFVYGVIFFGMLSSIVSMLLIRSALVNAQWSLADALSEKVEVTEREKDGTPLLDENNQPVLIKKMQASSSRMVALMGTIAILFLFLSFGAVALFHFAKTGKMPDGIDKVVTFLTAGLTLFAPYVVNKFSKSFEMLSPKR